LVIVAVVVDRDELRSVMRRFAAGIAVVTFVSDGEPNGLTVGSLVSLSLEPPLVGISIGLDSARHEPLRQAGRFAVSILAGDQEAVAQHFARSGIPPVALWTGIPLRPNVRSDPLIEGAVAWLGCVTRAEHWAGDHTLFVGEVEWTELGREAPALVYFRGGYETVE
jgi:3-hydroxy-9,10-secoandrosta-1,3,5(10)-triene-9,17-dione monooxygenase reductase component